jgi:ribosomal protein S18 acetylase RimI-like enzyme
MAGPDSPVRLLPEQKARSGQVLARAFLEDPLYSALLPDRFERERALQRMLGGVVGYSLAYGLAYTTPALDGAACWLPPGGTTMTLGRSLRTGFELQRAVVRFSPRARREFLRTLAFMDAAHKRDAPSRHWYLWCLGVEPACHGQGIGSRLLRPVLDQAGRDGVPCYLETETEGNVAFYRKHGFEVVSEYVLPGLGVAFWTMLREVHR